MNIHKINL